MCRIDEDFTVVEAALTATLQDKDAEVAAEAARSLKLLRDARSSK
jgi:hypothetical protein